MYGTGDPRPKSIAGAAAFYASRRKGKDEKDGKDLKDRYEPIAATINQKVL
jgi:hypothetical protein